MSTQAARELEERTKTDAALRDKIVAETDAEARLALAKAAGYDCSAEEIAGLAGQLSPAELDGVVAAGDCSIEFDQKPIPS